MRFVIVTGMSGAGKSTAMKMLEDFGYFCVDFYGIFVSCGDYHMTAYTDNCCYFRNLAVSCRYFGPGQFFLYIF